MSLGGPRQRAVLARLALVVGQVVTVDRLVDDVWAGDPPATAVNTLQSYVSLLRRALGDADAVRREGPGYVLAVDREVLDATRFEDRVAAGAPRSPPTRTPRSCHLDAALAEWQGPVLADVADEEWARPAAVRWDELRLEALEARFDALLALGRHGEAVSELERTADEHPLREGFARRLMIALYRIGSPGRRAARVLAHPDRARRGARPRPDARARRRCRRAILNHDPSLAAPAPAGAAPTAVETPTAGRRRRHRRRRPAPSPVALPGPAARAGGGDVRRSRSSSSAHLHRPVGPRSWPGSATSRC